MKNKNYWDSFYKEKLNIENESNFANFVFDELKRTNIQNVKLLDIACGNGRDTKYFSKNGIKSKGIDLSFEGNKDFDFEKKDVFDIDFSKFNVFYLRFFVHTITENDLDVLIKKFVDSANKNSLIFIETRSTTGITDEEKSETFFKSSIGDKHFRMLYSKTYLDKKFQNNFEIIHSSESNEYAIFKQDKPFCLRYILKVN